MSVSTICCSVCFDTINSSESVDATSCGHLFHRTCILRWLQTKQIANRCCPVCRRVIRSESLITIYPQMLLDALDADPTGPHVVRESSVDSLVSQLRLRNDLLDKVREENCHLSDRLSELNETIEIYRELHNLDRFRLLKQNLKSVDFEIETVAESISLIEDRISRVESTLKQTEQSLWK